MNQKINCFRTRVSLFYLILISIGTISCGMIAVYGWKSNDQEGVLVSIGFIVVFWLLLGGGYFFTSYHFDPQELVVQGDFRRILVPYLMVQKIYQREINPFFKGYNRKNSKKCGMGLRMIVIIYKTDNGEKRVMISPENEEVFLQGLYQRTGKNLETEW